MGDRDPVLYRIMEVSNAADPYCLLTPPIKRGQVWYCERIGLCNEDTGALVVDVGVFDGNQPTYFRSITLTVAGICYNIPFQITLRTEYQIVACFRGTTDGDRLFLSVNGYISDSFTRS